MQRTYDDLRDTQHEVIAFADANPFSAIWMDMGLGKTVSMLTLIQNLLNESRIKRALIVAPVRVAIQTWPGEIEEWEHIAFDYTLIRPTGREDEVTSAKAIADEACRRINLSFRHRTNVVSRAATMAEERVRRILARQDTPVHIINREKLPWLVWYWGDRWPYDCVIWDESSGLRSHKSERFRHMNRIRKYLTRLHELTGTPAPETYIDLFAQIYLLDQGARFGRGIDAFRRRYFTLHEQQRKWKMKPGADKYITSKIADICLVIQDETNDKPLLLDRPVTLTDDELMAYQNFEQTMIFDLPDGTDIFVEQAGALAQKLLQLSSGAVYDADKRYHVIHNHKIEELQQIVEEAQGSPILVAYWHKSSLDRLQKAFPSARKMDKEGNLQHPWNRGEILMMLLHPGSAGHGLNLQKGPGHILVFFDIPYSLELYLQIIARIARSGQARLVRVYHIWARDTVDSGVVPRLKAKESAQDYLLKRIRLIRSRYANL